MKIDKETYPNLMYLTKLTLKAHPWGHIQTLTYGEKRIGKSVYYILVMMDVYSVLYPELSVDERFKKALDNTLFTIEEFVVRIKKLLKGDLREPGIHIDDAGVGFNKYKYFSDRTLVEQLKGVIDTIGIVVTGLYLSSPTLHGVLGFLQEYEGFRIHITKRSDDFRRIAKVYPLKELPSGHMRIGQPKEDPFNCWLPDDLYGVYYKKRKKYLVIGIDKLEKYKRDLDERRQRDPDLEKTIKIVKAALQNTTEKINIVG